MRHIKCFHKKELCLKYEKKYHTWGQAVKKSNKACVMNNNHSTTSSNPTTLTPTHLWHPQGPLGTLDATLTTGIYWLLLNHTINSFLCSLGSLLHCKVKTHTHTHTRCALRPFYWYADSGSHFKQGVHLLSLRPEPAALWSSWVCESVWECVRVCVRAWCLCEDLSESCRSLAPTLFSR